MNTRRKGKNTGHLDAIKADCDALSMDIKKTMKLKDASEDFFADFTKDE